MIKNSLLRPGVFVQLQVIDFISVSITSAVCRHLLIQVHAYSVKKKWRGKLDIHLKRMKTKNHLKIFLPGNIFYSAVKYVLFEDYTEV